MNFDFFLEETAAVPVDLDLWGTTEFTIDSETNTPIHYTPLLPKQTLNVSSSLSTPSIICAPIPAIPANPLEVDSVEEKRKRNSAASARFRVKKKQKDQQMQQELDELRKREVAYVTRIHELESEVTWLRKLVLQTNDINV